jgi:fluoride ion exporter CrcB/FEX
MSNPVLLTLLIGAAGGVGAVIRFAIISWHGALPFGLFAVNILAGGFVGYIYSGSLAQDWLVIASVGLAGGLSTFAGVSAEGFDYYHRGRLVQMFLTLVINALMPLLAMMLVMRSCVVFVIISQGFPKVSKAVWPRTTRDKGGSPWGVAVKKQRTPRLLAS